MQSFNGDNAHLNLWAITVLMVVVASWIFYRHFAPKTWREWTGAGLVQAFIIALYAEMYGFPLTIYLLVRFFGLDRTYISTNLWSMLLGIGETGMFIAMLVGYVLLFVGVGLFIKGWSELYQANKEHRLVNNKLYGLVRHPQYTGLFIGLFGEGVVHWPTLFSVGLFPVIVVAYVLLAYREEKQMLKQFGEQYRLYQERVPMFWPRKGGWQQLLRYLQSHDGQREVKKV